MQHQGSLGELRSNGFDIPKLSRKFAEDFAKTRSRGDSILAAAREMKDTYQFFDESAYFDWLREHQDDYGFTPDQKKELITGVADTHSNWGDLALFPTFSRSAAHDKY